MPKLPPHLAPGSPAPGAPDDRPDFVGRRRLLLLCWLYAALLVAAAGVFMTTDYRDLLAAREGAVARLADLEAQPEVTHPAQRAPDPAAHAPVDQARSAAGRADAAVTRARMHLGGFLAGLLVVVYFMLTVRRNTFTAAGILNTATVMIIVLGLVVLASRLAIQKALPGSAGWGLAELAIMHLAAGAILRWSGKETTLPFIPLLGVWAVTFLVPGATGMEMLDRVVVVIISPAVLIPGALLANWRERRREDEAERIELAGRVESFGGELSRARIVHDAMFPPSFTGHVAFEYEYQPIHEIGGDYVHAHASPDTGRVTLTLLDVAGHGLAAALTVNRLFGELERIIAENPAADPAELMTLLNRYIYLTMARHSMYATGTSMMLDPVDGTLTWVSAGHPPALVRRAAGTVEELPTTSIILGVMEPNEFDPGTQQVRIGPGDTVIAFTDGAFEARDFRGERFGLDRLRETATFSPPPRSWPKFIAGAVARHHEGNAEDDVLIAALTLRSLRVPDASEIRMREMSRI